MSFLRRRFVLLLITVFMIPLIAACGGGGDENQTVKIGWIPWDEDIAASQLWAYVLEEEGYEVELTQLDAGTVYQGLANGDIDLFHDGWLPSTHAPYWEQFGDQLEQVGTWYGPTKLALAVPDYVDVQSLAELSEHADAFDQTIVGIEPSAGMMGIAREDIMPGYGLEDWTLVESSTSAMLAELDRALANEEPIVVTLWSPHWAYAEYDIRDLEDPEGLWGPSEEIYVIGREGFTEDFPEVAAWHENFQMDDEALGTLEAMILEAEDGDQRQAVEDWLAIEENRALVDSWLTDE